jgi:glycosyltransferase domain-containing protein
MNRREYLQRVIKYYENVGLKSKIIIGDSSIQEHAEANVKLIESSKLNIKYKYYPSEKFPSDSHAIVKMIESVDTSYVVFQGDDDFLVPSSLEKCAEFLDDNLEYVAAYGLRVNVTYKNDIGEIETGYLVKPVEFLSESPVDRWALYMQTGLSTQYYVHRTEVWRRMYKRVSEMFCRYIGPELLPCSLTAISGKTKMLDTLHYVMQKGNFKVVDFSKTSLFSMINTPEWSPSQKIYHEEIVSALIESGVSERAAEWQFMKHFYHHVANVMLNQYIRKYLSNENKYPNVLNDVLLDKNWKFYNDFQKIYEAAK